MIGCLFASAPSSLLPREQRYTPSLGLLGSLSNLDVSLASSSSNDAKIMAVAIIAFASTIATATQRGYTVLSHKKLIHKILGVFFLRKSSWDSPYSAHNGWVIRRIAELGRVVLLMKILPAFGGCFLWRSALSTHVVEDAS